MSSTHPHTPPAAKPTSRQLNYLKFLADQRGQTFAYPKTKAQASQEINRLKGTTRTTRDQHDYDRIVADTTRIPADATRHRTDEVTGYGASAQFAGRRA